MSFFGFDPSRNPGGRPHPSAAPGFSNQADPFAGLSGAADDDEGEEVDFEDTFDDLNDETFGGGTSIKAGGQANRSAGTDFFGRPAQTSDAIEEEQVRYQRQPPTARAPNTAEATRRPARTGYEQYQNAGVGDDLQIDLALWGQAPAQPTPQAAPSAQAHQAASRKMMTLEEIEAQMSGSGNLPGQPASSHSQLPPQQAYQNQFPGHAHGQQIDPRLYQQAFNQQTQPQVLQRPQQPPAHQFQNTQTLQHQHQHSIGNQMHGQRQHTPQSQGPQSGPGFSRATGPAANIVTHPQQLMNMSDSEKAAFLAEDAKRAKRNHKIWELSRFNGLMTPQDKNFITRIQLQQLMTATGTTDDRGPDSSLSEDFYYQVITSIRGGPRQNPNQPLSHFAQTYLFQTGGRGGPGNKKHGRADNHMQRMEQQVQRAVEAAKLKPKNKQLVLEGSLGKISFSNAKTPKPLLNIKRHDSADMTKRPGSKAGASKELTGSDRKTILRNIETVYNTLMKLEDESRKEPFLPPDVSPPPEDFTVAHGQWDAAMATISSQLWDELKVLEPINSDSAVLHPFIAFLSHAKGKKAIPRVFRYLNTDQRITILTMIVLHLDHLDVIRRGALGASEINLHADAKESIELFSMTVTPSLFGYVSEASLFTIIGLLGLIIERVNVVHVARTKVGLSILTMLTSRATIIKESNEASDAEWQQWTAFYNRLFDTVQPVLPGIFPSSLGREDDMYAWQFLAAVGSGASPEQQQALVIGVKDRVMETIQQSKTLPPDLASQKRANVNLFMRAIGLDVDLLE